MRCRSFFLGLNRCSNKPFFVFFAFVVFVFFSPLFVFAAEDEKKDPAFSQDKFEVNLPGHSTSEMDRFDQRSVQKIQESLKAIGYDIGAVFGLIDKKTSTAVRKFREDFEIVSDDLFSDHLIATLFHYAEVAKIHPDWKDITLSQSFTNWINKQPTKEQVRISKLRRSGSAKQIVILLNAYKADQKKAEVAVQTETKKIEKKDVLAKTETSTVAEAKTSPDESPEKVSGPVTSTSEKMEAKKEETSTVPDPKTLSISAPPTPAVMKAVIPEKEAVEAVAAPVSVPETEMPESKTDAVSTQDSGALAVEASFQTILEQAKDLKAFDPSKQVTWEGDDCGCLVDLSGKTIYGFYPFWLAGEPQKIDFSLLSRIAYYALSFDKKGDMSPLLHWHPRTADFVTEAQRYRTKVDLVIYKNDWKDWFQFSTKDQLFIIDKTTTNIVAAVHQKMPDTLENRVKSWMSSKESTTMGDGVTLYFDQYPEDARAVAFFESFIKTLHLKLDAANPNYKLNLMLTMDAIGRGIYTFENLEKFMRDEETSADDDIDLFLVILEKPTTDTKKALRLSFEQDHSFKGNQRKNMLRKIIPVISPVGHAPESSDPFEHDLIYFEDNFGGVGFWPLPLTTDKNAEKVTEIVDRVFNKTKDLDLLHRMLPEDTFSLCKWICPNRWYFRLAYDLLFALLLVYGLIALQNTVLRNIFNQYRQFFILTVLLAILILYSAVMCDPYLNGKKDEVTLALIFIGIFFWIWRNYIQMKEAKYP